MKFVIIFLILVVHQIHSHIEDADAERKPPQTVTPFAPILVDYDDNSASSEKEEELAVAEMNPPPLATIYSGRNKRAIHDPVADYLDDKATNAVFNDKQSWGPPSIPPYNYRPSPAPTQQEYTTTSRPELPPYTQPPATAVEETTWSETRPVENQPGPQPPSPLAPSTKIVSYDLHVDPDFPVDPPRARGLADGSSGGQVDAEFNAGYRWKGQPRVGGFSGRNYDIGPRGRGGQQGYGSAQTFNPSTHNYAPSAPVYSGYPSPMMSPSTGSYGYHSSQQFGSYQSQMASSQSYFVPNSNFHAIAAQVAQQPLSMSAPSTYSYGSYSQVMPQSSLPSYSYGSYSPTTYQAQPSTSYGSTWSAPPQQTSGYVLAGK